MNIVSEAEIIRNRMIVPGFKVEVVEVVIKKAENNQVRNSTADIKMTEILF